MPPALTRQQKASFHDKGYLHLPGAIKSSVTNSIKQHLLSELKRLNIWASGRPLSSSMKDMPAFQQITKLNQLVKHPGLGSKLISPDLIAMMEELAGSPLSSSQEAQLLLSLPNQGEWKLSGLNWHLDIAHPGNLIPGVQAFIILDKLLPHGGATLAMAGSHHLKNSHALYTQLRNEATPSMTIDGVPLELLEMTGEAGDVYLMDMRLIHTPSINATKNIRMMATARFLRKA